jgi:hypothetical protein
MNSSFSLPPKRILHPPRRRIQLLPNPEHLPITPLRIRQFLRLELRHLVQGHLGITRRQHQVIVIAGGGTVLQIGIVGLVEGG